MLSNKAGAPEHMGTWGHVPTIFWKKALRMSHFWILSPTNLRQNFLCPKYLQIRSGATVTNKILKELSTNKTGMKKLMLSDFSICLFDEVYFNFHFKIHYVGSMMMMQPTNCANSTHASNSLKLALITFSYEA